MTILSTVHFNNLGGDTAPSRSNEAYSTKGSAWRTLGCNNKASTGSTRLSDCNSIRASAGRSRTFVEIKVSKGLSY